MANLNGSLSIYCEPLDKTNEKINIKIMRKIENFYLKKFNNHRRMHLFYNILNSFDFNKCKKIIVKN